MDRLAVRKQNHPELATASLRDWGPPSYTPVCLDILVFRALYCPLNPFVPDFNAIWTVLSGVEVAGRFHTFSLGAA